MQGLARYVPDAGRKRLASTLVGIAGAGGLGSNAAMLLVRSGVQRLRIVDHDHVDESNLGRQFYWPQDVGRAKVLALAERLAGLEPYLSCDALVCKVNAQNAADIFRGCRIVVEALDEAEQKAALCAALVAAGFFVVSASGLAGCGGAPMRVRRLGNSLVCVGDFSSDIADAPPLAPRVMQAAAMQADAVLAEILKG